MPDRDQTGVTARCWAGGAASHRRIERLWRRDAPFPAEAGSLLAMGNARSYSDVCLNPGGTLLQTRALDRFIGFDVETGILRCEAGVLLGEVLALTLPRGWFLPVLPGTRYATVGGAIANDVHGKNHRTAGSFGHHVRAIRLQRSDGGAELRDGEQRFAASIGGLGLTGLIVEAELVLRRVDGPMLEEHALVFGDLQEGLARLDEHSHLHEHSAAWLDCLPRARGMGRGLLLSARHCEGEGRSDVFANAPRLGLPAFAPLPLVNQISARAFNALYFWAARRRRAVQRRHGLGFLFTLDAVGDWHRLYGRRGLRQYQCVVPEAQAADALQALLDALAGSDQTCSLAVLKRFGDHPPAGMLSFPREGFTLALDFPDTGAPLLTLFERFDAIVREANGALYPAKDARMSANLFRHSFPRAAEFATHIDPAFSSGFWRRVWA